MSNGKGDSPRNCFSQAFRDNYDSINWGKKPMKTRFMPAADTAAATAHTHPSQLPAGIAGACIALIRAKRAGNTT